MREQDSTGPRNLGATLLSQGQWEFVVWAPWRRKMDLHLLEGPCAFIPMERDAHGYHRVVVKQAEAGAKYFYRLDESHDRPDPASRFQPEGVHGPSLLVDLGAFSWTDSGWKGLALEDSIFYELHVGTYTVEGTFEALLAHLDRLAALGVNTIELMPVAQFPGNRNWGYDGVYPFAVQNSYGTPADLQKLVNAAHARGLAVTVDVVYNHLGPEGNYLREYGPYFTDRYHTPWGAALNFDGPDSDEVRHFFIRNALGWFQDFHIDALRLDAIHGIFDASAVPFLAELSMAVKSLSARVGRQMHLIAESDLNDSRVTRPTEQFGLGLDAQWSDDFHHSVHTLLTSERSGYYADFGCLHHLAKTLRNGWYYAGQYSQYRRRKHGNSPAGLPPWKFVVCNQNHDQVGNRARGERLSQLTSFEGLKLAAGTTLLSPFVPLLFMGEEYGDTAPFQYFTSHTDPHIAQAVRQGRREDFLAFEWKGEIPDPQAESTFAASKLRHALLQEEPHGTLLRFYQMLLRFRREHPFSRAERRTIAEYDAGRTLTLLYETEPHPLAVLLHFGNAPNPLSVDLPPGTWECRIDSADVHWLGPGASLPGKLRGPGTFHVTLRPNSFAVVERTAE